MNDIDIVKCTYQDFGDRATKKDKCVGLLEQEPFSSKPEPPKKYAAPT